MDETMRAINRLLDMVNESKEEVKLLRTELTTASRNNSQLKDENQRLIKKIGRLEEGNNAKD